MSALPQRLSQRLPQKIARGDLKDLPEITATEAKNSFGRAFEAALAHGAVAITKRNQPKAVLLSVETYQALLERQQEPLHTLTQEFDALLSTLQQPAARQALDEAFEADPAQLGRAAVAAAGA
jgi:antitoxin Phd